VRNVQQAFCNTRALDGLMHGMEVKETLDLLIASFEAERDSDKMIYDACAKQTNRLMCTYCWLTGHLLGYKSTTFGIFGFPTINYTTLFLSPTSYVIVHKKANGQCIIDVGEQLRDEIYEMSKKQIKSYI
jgi:hypothetical protein